jgi:Subtilase family/PEP-CTERM motif
MFLSQKQAEHKERAALKFFTAITLPLIFSSAAHAIVSSNVGIDINAFVGAQTFYDAGYTGSRAVAAVIEAGNVWDGHESLRQVNTFLDAKDDYIANGLSYGQLGQYDQHATWVGAALAGRGDLAYQRGIAHGADLWSGSVATIYNSDGSFDRDREVAFIRPYETALITGVNGRKADVINSSWGGGNFPNEPVSRALDAMIQSSRATSVVSAGNRGSGRDAVNTRPSAYNSIKVGALGTDSTGYNGYASFSSRGGINAYIPKGRFSAGYKYVSSRVAVDIVAPGANLTLANYGGSTGANTGKTDATGGATDEYSKNMQGTSFSAPIVAGGATLLNDVAYDKFASNKNARDGQVIKVVLMNSADKPLGWDYGSMFDDGVFRSHLDKNYGAGAMNLSKAYTQFTEGTTDVAGLGGGAIKSTGWDYGVIQQGSFIDYTFADPLIAGTFSATLNWFVGRSYLGLDSAGSIVAGDDYFTDLDLSLYVLDHGVEKLVGLSADSWNNTEHLFFNLPVTGNYFLRVEWLTEGYDYVGNDAQTFGLAWSATSMPAVPEPETYAMVLAGLGLVGAVVRRRKTMARIESPCFPPL